MNEDQAEPQEREGGGQASKEASEGASMVDRGLKFLSFTAGLFFLPVTLPFKLFMMTLDMSVYTPGMKLIRYFLPGIDTFFALSKMVNIKPATAHMPEIPSVSGVYNFFSKKPDPEAENLSDKTTNDQNPKSSV